MEEVVSDQSGLPRQVAANILYDIFEKQAYTAIAIDRELRRRPELSQPQRNLITELVNGTVRMSKHLDWVLALFLQKDIARQPAWLRIILRLAAYQLLFMEQTAPEIAVDSAARMVRRQLGDGLVGVTNGVLRNVQRQRGQLPWERLGSGAEYLAIYYSQPEWIVRHLQNELPPAQLMTALEYYNRHWSLDLRCNALRGDREELLSSLTAEGAEASLSAWSPWSIRLGRSPVSLEQLTAWEEGRCYVQNEASMLAAAVLDPQPGELIYDFCCGLGGKSCHFAEWMGDRGEVRAFDLYPHKIKLLHDNARRLGISSIRAEALDLLADALPEELADRVFIDAPCSGLGVLNRRSDLRWRMEPEELMVLAALQARLLNRAAEVLKPGGVMVYATCTVNREENQNQVERFLRAHPAFSPLPFAEDLAMVALDPEERDACRRGMLLLTPGAYGTDGMFYARLQKE